MDISNLITLIEKSAFTVEFKVLSKEIKNNTEKLLLEEKFTYICDGDKNNYFTFTVICKKEDKEKLVELYRKIPTK